MTKEKAFSAYAESRARDLIKEGWSNEQIKDIAACKDIPSARLRQWRFRSKPKNATGNATPATPLQRPAETPKQGVQPLENATGTPVLWVFIKEAFLNFHPADALYFIGVGLACYAVADTLQGVGTPVSVVCFGVSAVALFGLKTSTGVWRVIHGATLLVFECANAAVHTSWANAALWKNVRSLPLSLEVTTFADKTTRWNGADMETPFYIACGVAAVLFASGLYACLLALKK